MFTTTVTHSFLLFTAFPLTTFTSPFVFASEPIPNSPSYNENISDTFGTGIPISNNSNSTPVTSAASTSTLLEGGMMGLGNSTMNGTGFGQKVNDELVYRVPQVPLDVDNYPVAPEGLELQQVHVYVRHGERTPVGVRLTESPANIPLHWNMCHTARRFRATVADMLEHKGGLGPEVGSQTKKGCPGSLNMRKLVERKDGSVVSGECLLGELTDVGRQSTYNFGSALRKLYVDKLGFIPDVLNDPNHVYFRSTNVPRTQESLQQIILGLYPNEKCHEYVYPSILIRNGKDENLIGNTFTCKRLELLQVGFAQAAASAYNGVLASLDKKLSKYIGGNPIRVDGKPRASGIMDTIRASIAHGIDVPPEFRDDSIVDLIEYAVVQEWFADKTEDVRRLAMGRLLQDLTKKMDSKIEKGHDEDPVKILVHSTHDTALAGLCSTLDVFDEKWPAFTASITFELFKKTNVPEISIPTLENQSILSLANFKGSGSGMESGNGTPSASVEHYIRMRYQNQNMELPLCAEKGKHLDGRPEFCTIQAFKERMRELIPEDWEKECVPPTPNPSASTSPK